MLLSQRIAANINHIQPMDASFSGATKKTIKAQLAAIKEYRLKIMRATKLVIPNEFMDYFHGRRSSTLSVAGAKLAPRHQLYVEYSSRLLSPTLFIENDNGGVLLESRPEGWVASFFITNFNNSGVPCTFFSYRLVFDRTKPFEEWCEEVMVVGDGEVSAVRPWQIHPGLHSVLRGLLTSVSEILLFVNAKNSLTREYIPTLTENARVPKDVIPKYTYKILDIYRDLKEADSLETVKKFIRTETMEKGQVRAHLVRGHFKRKKNGLFWWSPFLRARDNATKLGVVVKNYNLKVKD